MFPTFAFHTLAIGGFHERLLPNTTPRYLILSVCCILTSFIEMSNYGFENVLQLISYKLFSYSLLITLLITIFYAGDIRANLR